MAASRALYRLACISVLCQFLDIGPQPQHSLRTIFSRLYGAVKDSTHMSPISLPALKPGDLLAVVCLSFGISLAALTPSSLQERLGSFLLFGLIPAVGFYASAYIPARLWRRGLQAGQILATSCLW